MGVGVEVAEGVVVVTGMLGVAGVAGAGVARVAAGVAGVCGAVGSTVSSSLSTYSPSIIGIVVRARKRWGNTIWASCKYDEGGAVGGRKGGW